MFVNTVRIRGSQWYMKIIRRSFGGFINASLVEQNRLKQSIYFDLYRKCSWKRCSSTISIHPFPGSTRLTTGYDIKQFFSIYPDVVDDLTETIWDDDAAEFKEYYKKMLYHIFPKRSYGLGHAVAGSYKMLTPSYCHTLKSIRLANTLGWCIEMLGAAISITDDIRDKAETRLGVPCWHLHEKVGLRAIVDAQVIEHGVYLLARKYCSDHPSYVHILELFQKLFMNVAMGQALDEMCNTKSCIPFLELFTTDRYNTLVKYKTAQGSLFSLRLAMYLANIIDHQIHSEMSNILLKLGYLWQLENDILDCYGDPSEFGKVSEDIRNGSCTWLIVKAIQKASPQQKKILEQNYGKPEPEYEKIVRNLYDELDIMKEYVLYRSQQFNLIKKEIEGIQSDKLQKMFCKMCDQYMEEEVLCWS